MLDTIDKKLLVEIADWHTRPKEAFNIRKNGHDIGRNTTENINILTKKNKPGIDVIIEPGTRKESVYVPTILSQGLEDKVYYTFEIGANTDVRIVAGCGIHNHYGQKTRHEEIHEFLVRKGARMKCTVKHYGEGNCKCQGSLDLKIIIEVEENGVAELEIIQLEGVDRTLREIEVRLQKNARLMLSDRLLTNLQQSANSNITVSLWGEGATAEIISRSVAQNDSQQFFHFIMRGYVKCSGHSQCESVIMNDAQVSYVPEVCAFNSGAQLIHDTNIGHIASEQLIKLMTLGFTPEEAQNNILQGFLK